MNLRQFRVRLYRNIVDSGEITLDDAVTCLVGKNESGKTALLQALYSLKPAYPKTVRVNIIMDYPRWRKVRDERDRELEEVVPIEAVFDLDEEDLQPVKDLLPFQVPKVASLFASRSYGNALTVRLDIAEADLLVALLSSDLLTEDMRSAASAVCSIGALRAFVEEQMNTVDKRTRTASALSEFQKLVQATEHFVAGSQSKELQKALETILPTFFYFSEYSSLKGRIDLTGLLQKQQSSLSEEEQTALSLLRLVGVQGKEFMGADFEVRVAELEAAANEVTRQIFEFWTQNTDLIVNLHGDSETVQSPQGQTVAHRFLDVRLNDLRHQMTTNFETRSSGFQWFFSFIVAFTEFERQKNVIVLLDEPALGLHARAQADLLRFIEERLGAAGQVLYTTHSPFMVNPRRLEIVRLVEDLSSRTDPDIGAKVSTDVLSVKGDTLFPLQAALGYDIAQNLYIGGYNLVVEGTSDLAYLQVLSSHLLQLGRRGLDKRFTITPVGGADKIPTFVSLLGTHLDVTVLVDSKVSKSQKLAEMIKKGLLRPNRLVSVGQVSPVPAANVEDLFEPEEYLSLYNHAFSASLDLVDLQGSDSIVNRIQRFTSSEYDHLRPALALLHSAPIPALSDDTLGRFERLFELLNATLAQPQQTR